MRVRLCFFFSSRRRHTRWPRDWSSDVCSSDLPEEKYRAVINGGHPDDEQVGQRWGKVEPALWGRRRYSFTHRTKVFADGTIRKISCVTPGDLHGSRPKAG